MYMNNPWHLIESVKDILTAEQELVIKDEKVIDPPYCEIASDMISQTQYLYCLLM